jgi:hypothetical protein
MTIMKLNVVVLFQAIREPYQANFVSLW